MSYNKTKWISGETLLSADNLNHIEDGIANLDNLSSEITLILSKVNSNLELTTQQKQELEELLKVLSDLLATMKEILATPDKEKLATPIIKLINIIDDLPVFVLNKHNLGEAILGDSESYTNIIGQLVLGHAILTGSKLDTPVIRLTSDEKLSTPIIKLVTEETLEKLATPVIELYKEEDEDPVITLEKLATPVIELYKEEDEDPVITLEKLATPVIELYKEEDEDPVITLEKLATPVIYLEQLS